jgi:hypothetical protein
MGYFVKVQFAQNMSIEVSADEVVTVVQLLNETTKKFFPSSPASKIEI